jgi:hypothetical protein
MRAYTVATTAVTLRMPEKWLDNVLSQNTVDGVIRKRQGVARRLTPKAVLTLDIAARLVRALGATMPAALRLARQLIEQGTDRADVDAGEGLRLTLDLQAIERDLMERLAQAVEIAPSPQRGRPRRKTW